MEQRFESRARPPLLQSKTYNPSTRADPAQTAKQIAWPASKASGGQFRAMADPRRGSMPIDVGSTPDDLELSASQTRRSSSSQEAGNEGEMVLLSGNYEEECVPHNAEPLSDVADRYSCRC